MKKVLLSAGVAVAAFGLGFTDASAKTKAAVKPYPFNENYHHISGKATKGATIKISRYSTVYAYGTATKRGNFSFKLKHNLIGGSHVRITVAKKGYKTTRHYYAVGKVDTTPYSVTTPQTTVTVPTNSNSGTQNQPNSSVAPTAPQSTNVNTTPSTINIKQADIDDLAVLNKKIASVQQNSNLEYSVYNRLGGDKMADLQAKLKSAQDTLDHEQSRVNTSSGNPELTASLGKTVDDLKQLIADYNTILIPFNGNEKDWEIYYSNRTRTIDIWQKQSADLEWKIAHE